MAGLLDDPGGSTGSGGSSGGGDGGGILSRIVGLLGAGVSGGDAGIATLGPDQEAAADRRALMNFGIAMMASAGPHYGAPRSAGQIIASGLAAGEASRTASETAAASAQKTAFQQRLDTAKEDLAQTVGTGNLDVARGGLDVSRGSLDVSRGELSLKAQELAIKLRQLAAAGQAAQPVLTLLQGGGTGTAGGGAAGAAGGAAAPGDPAWLTAIGPAPAPTANAATFKDAAVRDKIIATAKAEGVDPNVALAYALRESSGDPAVQPGDGGRSRGLFQIGKSEAASVGVDNPDDPEQNILAGVRYIKSLQNDPKYGADPATTLLAYAAGKGAADSVLAGQRPAPAIIAQHVANLRAVQAQNPAGVPPPGGAPGAGGGDRGYVPSSGERTAITPGAAPAAGSAAPSVQASIAALPPEIRGIYGAQLSAAQTSGDPAQVSAVLQDIAKAATEYAKRPQMQVIPRDQAMKEFGTAYDPTAIYERNLTDGSTKVTQQGQAPVNVADTPEAKASAVSLTMAQKRLEGMDTTAQSAHEALANLAVMKPLAAAAGSANQLFAEYPQVSRWLITAGVGTQDQINKWTAGQALDAVANYMAFENKPAGISRLTNFDLQRLLTSVPSMGDTPQTRELKIAILQNAANRRIQENSFAQNYFMTKHTLAGVDDAMAAKLGTALPHAPPVANLKAATPAEVAATTRFRSTLGDGDLYYGPDSARPGRMALKIYHAEQEQ